MHYANVAGLKSQIAMMQHTKSEAAEAMGVDAGEIERLERLGNWIDGQQREALVLLFKWRIISGQQRGDQSEARRIVINNQNPFKIVHAIWLRPEAHLTYTQDCIGLDRTWSTDKDEKDVQATTASTPRQVRGRRDQDRIGEKELRGKLWTDHWQLAVQQLPLCHLSSCESCVCVYCGHFPCMSFARNSDCVSLI